MSNEDRPRHQQIMQDEETPTRQQIMQARKGTATRYRASSLGEVFKHASSLNGGKKYATWPVHSGSFRSRVGFVPLTKQRATKLYHKARKWNRRKAAHRYGGYLGSAALRVLECLIFDFLDFASGRLDPSYEGIAKKTGLGRSTVAKALARLKELRVISWLRRCTESRDAGGRYAMRQLTNAYAVLPSSQWRGFLEAPPPHPTEWGAVPPLPSLIEQALQELTDGGSNDAATRILGTDPDDKLAAALADFGSALRPKDHVLPGVLNLV